MNLSHICLLSCFLVVSSQRCPTGWFGFQDRCFWTDQTQESGTWFEARDDCKLKGGTLAIVDSLKVNVFLNKFTKQKCWIGLHDIDEEGQFYWVDDTIASFTNWGPGEPNEQAENVADCVDLETDGFWNDKDCNETLWTKGYICQRDMGPEDNSPKCTDGWFLFDDRCFYVDQIEANRTWYNARDECITLGGTLAIVDNMYVQFFLEQFTTAEGCWIGLQDFDEEGEFSWVDGTLLSSTVYKNWKVGDPHNMTDNANDCVEMEKDGKWNDKPCLNINWVVGVMCQKEPERTPTTRPTTTTTVPITRRHATVPRAEIDNGGDDSSSWRGGLEAVIVICSINALLLLAIMVYVFVQHYRQRDGKINSTGAMFSKGSMSVDLQSGIDNQLYQITNPEA